MSASNPAYLLLALPLTLCISASILTPIVAGVRVLVTFCHLNALRKEKEIDASKPHIYTPLTMLLQTHAEPRLTRHDLKARRIMARTRAVVLYGPLTYLPGSIAIPTMVLCHYNNIIIDNNGGNNQVNPDPTTSSIVTVSLTAISTMALLTLLYTLNATTLHYYFSLIQQHGQDLHFGDGIKTAAHERSNSRGVKKAYLRTLFALCALETKTDASDLEQPEAPARRRLVADWVGVADGGGSSSRSSTSEEEEMWQYIG